MVLINTNFDMFSFDYIGLSADSKYNAEKLWMTPDPNTTTIWTSFFHTLENDGKFSSNPDYDSEHHTIENIKRSGCANTILQMM